MRADLTRGRILAAAAHVFAEHGYAAGTTNRIAERARIFIGPLYQYFPNKDAILVSLVRHIDRGSWTQAEHLDLSAGSRPATVRALVRDAIDHHRDDPRLLRIMIEQASFSRELLDTVTGTAGPGSARCATCWPGIRMSGCATWTPRPS